MRLRLPTVQILLNLFRGNPVGQQGVDVLRIDPKAAGHRFQVPDVDGVLDLIVPAGVRAGQWLVVRPFRKAGEGGVKAAVVKLPSGYLPLCVDGQNLPAVNPYPLHLSKTQLRSVQGLLENFFRAGIDVNPLLWKMEDAQRVIPLDEEQLVLLTEGGNGEGSFQLLCHIFQAAKVQAPGLLQQLHRHIAVGFNLGVGKLPGFSEQLLC